MMFSFLTVESAIAVLLFVGGLLGWLWRTATKATKLEATVEGLEEDVKKERHDRKNLATKFDALDRSHNATVNRIVRLETDLTAIRKATERTDDNVIELLKMQREN